MAAAGLSSALHPTTCDAVSVIVDAMLASGSFRAFSFWNVVAVACARVATSPPQVDVATEQGVEGGKMTLDEVMSGV
jgi:hypothetical protein